MKKKIILGVILLLSILLLSGCTTNKYIYVGKFSSVEEYDGMNTDAKGIFETNYGETLTIYIRGDWRHIEVNRDMEISVEYYGGYKLLSYRYME